MRIKSNSKSSNISSSPESTILNVTNERKAYAESEAYDSVSVVPIHTRSELSSDSDSAYDSASVVSVASVNQLLCLCRVPLHAAQGEYKHKQNG